MFVLKRDGDGAYVAKNGIGLSYTKKLELADIFKTREDADRSRCVENEKIVPLSEILSGLNH